MAIPVISKITQKNNMTFKLMDAKNVSYDGTEGLSVKDKVDEISNKIELSANVIVSDSEPTTQNVGDIWIESL